MVYSLILSNKPPLPLIETSWLHVSTAYPVLYVSVVSSIPAILRITSKLFSNKIVVRFIFHNLKSKPWTLKNFTLRPCIYCRMCYVTWRKIRWHHWLVCLSSSDCFWLNKNIRYHTERRLFTVPYFSVRSSWHIAYYPVNGGHLYFQMYRGGGRRGLCM